MSFVNILPEALTAAAGTTSRPRQALYAQAGRLSTSARAGLLWRFAVIDL